MDIRFKEQSQGRRLFRVFHVPEVDIFVGTLHECRRFMEIHDRKVRKQLNRKKIPKPQINRQCRTHLPPRSWERL